jgi:D-arabinose 1-dehydrogenase-like Zn-dependent alcohol dehydrogenase
MPEGLDSNATNAREQTQGPRSCLQRVGRVVDRRADTRPADAGPSTRGNGVRRVGLPQDNVFPLPIFETVLRGIQVIGSLVGTREDLAEVFQLHAGGRTQVVLERRELEQG